MSQETIVFIFNVDSAFIELRDTLREHLSKFQLSYDVDRIVEDMSHAAVHQASGLVHMHEGLEQKEYLRPYGARTLDDYLLDSIAGDICMYLEEAEYIIPSNDGRIRDDIDLCHIEISRVCISFLNAVIDDFINVFKDHPAGISYYNDPNVHICMLDFLPLYYRSDVLVKVKFT